MIDLDRKTMRLILGEAVMLGQKLAHEQGYEPEQVIPEIIASLLSLAANIAKKATPISRENFLLGCSVAADEEWSLE